jgi:tetratricopeptide (TPR) repeat protein
MSIARYGHKWFLFRKRWLGIGAAQADETIDLTPFFLLGRILPGWDAIRNQIPDGERLAGGDVVEERKAALQNALESFDAQQRDGLLSLDMQYLHALALEMSGRIDLAKAELERIVELYPEEQDASMILLSEMYERKGDWIRVYEELRTYLEPRKIQPLSDNPTVVDIEWPPDDIVYASASQIRLNPLTRLINAQLELRLHLAALHTAKVAYRMYPYSARIIELLATAHMRLDQPEEALALLGQPRVRDVRSLDLMEAEALLATERFNTLADFNRKSLLPQVRIDSDAVQHVSLPSAELSLLWHQWALPSEQQFAETAEAMRRNLSTAGSGLRPLLELWLAAYEGNCEGDLADQQRWLACGRDGVERATAMNQLTLLLCREERFLEAQEAARVAVSALPDVPVLWTILIGLSGGNPDLVADARRSCPESPDIWLADLVAGMRQRADDDPKVRAAWGDTMVTEALDADMLPATLTRAGEYLWRLGVRDAACRLARYVTPRARGLLPAYVLAIRCALYEQDEVWALECTQQAINSALQPLPELYRNLVALKMADGEMDTDPDMVNALRNLRKADPDNPIWPQMLGYIRFQRGGWEIIDALVEMNVAIAGGATNRVPYLIASEVSRLLQNYGRAADILKKGLQHNPGTPVLINNLAYTLSHDADQIADAVKLIPQLERLVGRDPRIRDTLAVVYLRSGRLDEAHAMIKEMLTDSKPASPLWFRANMHLAEIAWLRGNTRQAKAQLENLIKSSRNIPDEDILAANALLARVMGENAEYMNPMRAFVRGQLNGTTPQEAGEQP